MRDAPSVDVEHGLAADAALEEGVERSGGLPPRGFELDLAVQSPVGHQRAEAGEVAGAAGVGGELVGQVQRVDPRSLSPVEARRMEGDGLVVALGRDVDDDATRGDVLDGKAERRASDSVDDQVEVAGEGLDDVGGAEPRRSSCAAAASRTNAVTWAPLSRASWIAIRPTPPVAPVTSTRLPSTRPATSSARSAVSPAVGSVAACASDTTSGIAASLRWNRGELRPGTSVDQADHAGAAAGRSRRRRHVRPHLPRPSP